jgi:ABC-type multidrug transport system ATPase subunit
MRCSVQFEHVALSTTGKTLSLQIEGGQLLVVLGPNGAGRADFLRVATGKSRPPTGTVNIHGTTYLAEVEGIPRRTRPINVVRPRPAVKGQEVATRWFVGLGLWDSRQKMASELTRSERASLDILAALASDANIIGLDRQLDLLDPWTLDTTLELIQSRQREGTAWIVVTNQPALARLADMLIVLRNREVAFAGTQTDLLRLGPRHLLTVATENQAGVRSIVEPFEVSLENIPEGVRMSTADGQSASAKLLQVGYGDVKFIINQPPRLEDALLRT